MHNPSIVTDVKLAPAHTISFALAALSLLIGAGSVAADGGTAAAESMCAEASHTRVQLPPSASVDEIRVIVADHSPEQGAATVSVEAGRFGRVVRVHGAMSRGLTFSSPLTGGDFEVALDPVFEAQRSACVERILLLRGGALVASIQP